MPRRQVVTTTRREPQDHLVAVLEASALAALVSGQRTAAAATGGHALTETMLQLGRESGKKVTVLCWGLDKLCRSGLVGLVGESEKGLVRTWCGWLERGV